MDNLFIPQNHEKCLIIAEAGVNHNGRVDLAFELCKRAKEVGADVVKFQTWDTDRLITRDLEMASYQEKNTNSHETQYDMLKRLELSYDDFRRIKEYCDEIGIIFASTADEEQSLDFLVELGIPFIKVGSGDIGNIPFLRYIGSKGLPIIMSTGMSSLEDVNVSLEALYSSGAKEVSLLHCTTNYPCPFNEVNLRAMITLREKFGVPVGYSDHTIGTEVPVSAVALGARIIEKHFTLDKKMDGPDHIASTEPAEFKLMVDQIRNIECALGDGIKRMTSSEKGIKSVVTKRIVAAKPIRKGDVFSNDNVCIKRCSEGALPYLWDKLIGETSHTDYSVDQGIIFLN